MPAHSKAEQQHDTLDDRVVRAAGWHPTVSRPSPEWRTASVTTAAADQQAMLTDHGDDRNRAFFSAWMNRIGVFARALGARRTDVILLAALEHGRRVMRAIQRDIDAAERDRGRIRFAARAKRLGRSACSPAPATIRLQRKKWKASR